MDIAQKKIYCHSEKSRVEFPVSSHRYGHPRDVGRISPTAEKR